ncbi:hypothetical protein NBRC116592_17030 [Colwellia sp. KU-HH00111]|uniref:hypothetical protein n=1 Tax=Colwellia sp. KU-HH00111 TaxID=3127652 RepID=UPI00310711DF
MLIVFAVYWAFFTWFFTDNFIINFIYDYAQYGYISVCGSFKEGNQGCLIEDVVVNFPAFLAFILAFILTVNSRRLYE